MVSSHASMPAAQPAPRGSVAACSQADATPVVAVRASCPFSGLDGGLLRSKATHSHGLIVSLRVNMKQICIHEAGHLIII